LISRGDKKEEEEKRAEMMGPRSGWVGGNRRGGEEMGGEEGKVGPIY